MKIVRTLLIVFLIAAASCKPGNRKQNDTDIQTSIKKFQITEVWRTDTLLRTPESVIHDSKRDVLYVTNVNMEPRKKDGNGFISKVSTEGKIIELKWVVGLNAPKGTAVVGDTLYVADIDELIVIDIRGGRIARKVTVEGIGMINDITSDAAGALYVSDTDAGKIYKYGNGKLTDWYTEGLKLPNGLLAEKKRILLASMGTGDLVAIDHETKSRTLLADSLNRADGIVHTGIPGYYIVTDWAGEIFMVNPGMTRTSLLNTKSAAVNTADCEFIAERNLLLVPTFFKNCIVAYTLSEKQE